MDRKQFLKIAFGGIGGLVIAGGKGLSTLENGALESRASSQTSLKGFAKQAINPFIHPTLASDNTDDIGLQLVCIFDISASIDMAEYELQLEAMAEAIESDEFKNAVFYPGGPQSIAICISDFSASAGLPVPWLDIRKGDDHKFKLLADEIRKIPRRQSSITYQHRALEYASELLDNCPWAGERTVIDIMTDGIDTRYGRSQKRFRDLRRELATKHKATINALITLDPQAPKLHSWTKENLITQVDDIIATNTRIDPGFVKVVATQETDEHSVSAYQNKTKQAFHRKLILEVGQIDLDDLRTMMSARNGIKIRGRHSTLGIH